MRKIPDVAAEMLTWKEHRGNVHNLTTGVDNPVGRLTFRNSWGTQATAESGDGSWTFKRVGFFKPKVTVRLAGSEQDVATFHNNTWSRGGSLVFADGTTFQATTNFWQTQYEITTDDERPLVKMHYGGFFRLHADVEILPEARTLKELPVIVLLSWYLAIMLHRDSTAAGAAAAAAAG